MPLEDVFLPPPEEDLAKLIKRYGLELNERGAKLAVPCERFYTGSSFGLDLYSIHVPLNFSTISAWSNGFREVWVSQRCRAIFTYCEGDLDLTVDTTDELFETRLKAAAEFYEEH